MRGRPQGPLLWVKQLTGPVPMCAGQLCRWWLRLCMRGLPGRACKQHHLPSQQIAAAGVMVVEAAAELLIAVVCRRTALQEGKIRKDYQAAASRLVVLCSRQSISDPHLTC